MMKKIIILYLCFLIASCASIVKEPDVCDVEYCKIKFPKTTFEDLNSGYKLYIKKCGGCHFLYSPKYYSNADWDKTLPEMMERSKVNSIEELQIRKYIFSINRDFE